jgi:hypothetical protein
MAETTTVMTKRKFGTLRITDGGTIDYTVSLIMSMSYTPGHFDPIDVKDTNGNFTGLSPTAGEEQPTTGTIEATQRGLAGRALEADMGLIDFIDRSGFVASGATSTGTESGSVAGEHIVMYDMIVTMTDEKGTVTYTFTDCTFEGSSWTTDMAGNKLSISFTSRKSKPTVVFV